MESEPPALPSSKEILLNSDDLFYQLFAGSDQSKPAGDIENNNLSSTDKTSASPKSFKSTSKNESNLKPLIKMVIKEHSD